MKIENEWQAYQMALNAASECGKEVKTVAYELFRDKIDDGDMTIDSAINRVLTSISHKRREKFDLNEIARFCEICSCNGQARYEAYAPILYACRIASLHDPEPITREDMEQTLMEQLNMFQKMFNDIMPKVNDLRTGKYPSKKQTRPHYGHRNSFSALDDGKTGWFRRLINRGDV